MHKINFPNMVYINLDHCIERKDYMENQMKLYNADIKRMSAIHDNFDNYSDDWKLLLNVDNPIHFDLGTHLLSMGEIGCLLSHLEAIRLHGTEDLIVFEDDVDLSVSELWQFSLNDLIEKIRGNMDILQLIRSREVAPLYIKDHIFGNNWGTAAYFISKSLCEEIVSKHYINNKWTLTNLPSKYHRRCADAVLYSFTKTYTCTLFSLAQFSSSIDAASTSRDLGSHILREMSSQNLTLDYYLKSGVRK